MRWTEVDPPPYPQVQQVKMLFPPPHMTSPEERANVTQATHNRTQHNDLARGGLGVSKPCPPPLPQFRPVWFDSHFFVKGNISDNDFLVID